MWTDRTSSELDRVERLSHSGLVPPPPGWAMEYTQLTPAAGQGECRDINLPGLLLRSSSFETRLSMSGCGERERHIFVFLSNLRGEGKLNGKRLDEGLVAVCGAQPFEVVSPPMDMVGMTIARDLLDGYLESAEGLVAPGWMDDGVHFVGNSEATRRAGRMIKALMTSYYDDPFATGEGEGRQALAFSVLDILVPILIDVEAERDHHLSNRYQIVRRTREYILDRIDEPLQISEICRELGVSRRALQYSFQDVLGLNPVAFLRILRLNRARRDLVRTERSLQVKDVIDRWGFWHPSRFSCEYKQMFEELPSETLRRCRAAA